MRERERGPVRVITSHHCVMFSQAQLGPGRLDPSQPLVMGRNTQEFFFIQRFLNFFFHDEQLIFLKTEDSRVWTLQFVEFQLHSFQLTDIETSVRLQWSCLVLYLELSAGQARVSPSHFLLLVSNNPVSPLIAPGRSSRLVIGPHNQGEPDAALIGGLLLRFDRKHQKGADTSWCSDIWVRLH